MKCWNKCLQGCGEVSQESQEEVTGLWKREGKAECKGRVGGRRTQWWLRVCEPQPTVMLVVLDRSYEKEMLGLNLRGP